MTANIISFVDYTASKKHQNVTHTMISSFEDSYNDQLKFFDINIEDPKIAFDVATIQFLIKGMVHRINGEDHPSQQLLDVMKNKLFST